MVGQESKEKPIRTRFLCTFTNCQGDEKWNDDDHNDDDDGGGACDDDGDDDNKNDVDDDGGDDDRICFAWMGRPGGKS